MCVAHRKAECGRAALGVYPSVSCTYLYKRGLLVYRDGNRYIQQGRVQLPGCAGHYACLAHRLGFTRASVTLHIHIDTSAA